MKRIFTLMSLITISYLGFSQQDPQISYYMYDHLAFNPGYAGSNDAICITSINRSQWLGFSGAPVTLKLGAHMPFNFNLGTNIIKNGVGINLMSDKLGFENNIVANLNYSYRMDVGSGVLGLGIQLGMLNKGLKAEWITPDAMDSKKGGNAESPTVGPNGDPLIPKDEAATSFDMGFGAFYKTTINGKDELYVGLSTTHLNQSKMQLPSMTDASYLARHYYLTAGYNWQLPNNPMFEIRPSIFVKNDGATSQFDITALVVYNKKFWGGLTVRDFLQESVDVLVGVTLPMNIKVGVAYDITMSKLNKYSNGSAELLLRYCFEVEKDTKKGYYRSARY